MSNSGGQICRKLDGSAIADLEVFAHVFFADWTFDLAHVTFWRHQFSKACTPLPTPPPPPPPPPPPALPTTETPSSGATYVFDGDAALPPEEESLSFFGDRTFSSWSAATGEPAEVGETMPANINPYRCVVLLTPRSLQPAQESQLASYARQGGTIVALGEHEGGGYALANETLNAFAASLGVGLSLIDGYHDYGPSTTFDINPSPLTEGVFKLGDNWASTLEVGGSAMPLAGTADGEGTLIAAQGVGSGQLVLAGDSNLFTDEDPHGYSEAENGQLVRNICP